MKKTLPVDITKLNLETPYYLYDEKAILDNARAFLDAFSWAPGFTNCYAVKACPNPFLIKGMAELGFGADCSSVPELYIARQAGVNPSRMIFSSNDTSDDEFREAYGMGAVINLDDITHIAAMERALGGKVPETICFRYNPGPDRTGNAIIGNPVEAKYGVTKDQIVDCYRIMKEKGVKRFGLHTMVASNELNADYIVETARMLFDLVIRINREAGVRISFIDMGGGIGIPYREEEERMDISYVSERMHQLYDQMIVPEGLAPLNIMFESGRYMTGPYGYLVSRVRHVAHKYKDYVGMDACMANLMRPALYGSYHHIIVAGKENAPLDHTYDVTGSLCENNDKFAIDRKLPEIVPGDLLAFCDAGAHGYAMGFNYNARLKCAEYLLKEDGSVVMIRRKETMEDYFATLNF